MTRAALTAVLKETIRRNRVRNGIVYLQVTRGTARRDHPFPAQGTPPSVVITSKSISPLKTDATAANGVAVITTPDIRWGRCDIKTVGLLANVLAKQEARDRGAFEAWMVDDMGLVTEGSSTNAWIIDEHGKLRTRDTQANILRGCTRTTLLDILKEEGIELEERAFTVEEAKRAKEAFFTAAGAFVMPAVSIDGVKIGDGKPGPVATRLRQLYIERGTRDAI
jgi:D-alanine transaminase